MINNTQQWVLFFYLSVLYQSAVKKWRADFWFFLIKKSKNKFSCCFSLDYPLQYEM